MFFTIIGFLVVLGLAVLVHELGHYWAARFSGVKINAFSIGFGPALLRWTDRRGTVWKISAIPLGGYVSLYGNE
ncbi:MAG: site-2 protease family protein, partial [Alphaproteobacteria bacterium]|nr:site-2 protease family protein [Alphaproteobacteria bacterium]